MFGFDAAERHEIREVGKANASSDRGDLSKNHGWACESFQGMQGVSKGSTSIKSANTHRHSSTSKNSWSPSLLSSSSSPLMGSSFSFVCLATFSFRGFNIEYIGSVMDRLSGLLIVLI